MSSKDSREFDPTRHFIDYKGRDYLPVPARLAWLVSEYPSYSITTLVDAEAKPIKATAHVRIYKDDGTLLREATAIKVGAGAGAANTPMGVETGAVGRALGMLGFGTMQAGEDFEEDGEVMGGIADSPVERKAKPAPKAAPMPTPAQVDAALASVADDGPEWAEEYDHAAVTDNDLFSEAKVRRLMSIGGALFGTKGDATYERTLTAASNILQKNVADLHALHWKDGNKVMESLEAEAVKRGKWQPREKSA
jgi:hypothetical protein